MAPRSDIVSLEMGSRSGVQDQNSIGFNGMSSALSLVVNSRFFINYMRRDLNKSLNKLILSRGRGGIEFV